MRSLFHAALLCYIATSVFCFKAYASTKDLNIYFVDVEGGQATLIVTPSRQSLLIDTGWPGFNGRDADRIMEVARNSGLQKINYVLITHYHTDHVGGVPQLLQRIKVEAFLDHGPNTENDELAPEGYAAYQNSLGSAKHLVVKPGDRIPIPGIDVEILTSDRAHITKPVSGDAVPNPYCASEPKAAVDPSENAASVGVLVTYGRFRFLDLGDLTKQKELEMVCPVNPIGHVDLFLVSHHGFHLSNSKALVFALHPRVAVVNNGAQKGNDPIAWQTVHDSPGLEDLWQLHYKADAGADHNVSKSFIANLDKDSEGHFIKVSAQPSGAFRVLNSRNGYEKLYPSNGPSPGR